MFRSDPSHSGADTGDQAPAPPRTWIYHTFVGVHSSISYYTSLSVGVYSSPAVINDVVYVGSEVGEVYALNATNGIQLWSYPASNYVYSSPAVVNGVVYIGSDDGNVYALNANNGDKLWNYTTSNEVTSSPAVADGVV
ncbi:MAG: PQQ-binding-like beta-propeller repeat protein, partial [Candidatus Bathyarchaeia archaeon]